MFWANSGKTKDIIYNFWSFGICFFLMQILQQKWWTLFFDGQKWVNHHFSGFIGRFLKSTSCKCPEFTAYHAIVSTEFLTWTSDAVTSGFWLVASAKLRLTFKLKSPGWLLLDGNAKPNNSWLRMEYKIMSSLNLTQFLRLSYWQIW